LWDILPSGTVPGGAPMNVAIRAQSFGLHTTIISRIGNDNLGQKITDYLNEKQLDLSFLQKDTKLPTGKVNVVLDSKGIASYDIKYPSAWDKIEASAEAIEKVKKVDAFIFGSLACRDKKSRDTLLNLLDYAQFKVFDVNLRPGFFDLVLIEKLMRSSDLVKLNDEELLTLAKNFGSGNDGIKENIKLLHEKFKLNSICVTQGEDGAILFVDNVFYSNSGINVEVADTVGSGDSFLAALIFKLLSQTNPNEAINFACAIGALVATKSGANPELTTNEINWILEQNNSL